MDFESDAVGQPPPGWTVDMAAAGTGASAMIDGDRPESGHASARLTLPPPAAADAYASATLRRDIDAAPYRGKIVVIHLAMRTDIKSQGAFASVIFRARAERVQGRFYPDAITNRAPSVDWTSYDLPLAVPADADRLALAMSQTKPGSAWLDSVRIHIADPAEVGWEAPRPLTPRGIANLHAFARLLGYVRFFHPSDQAAAADWNSIAIAGVQRIEDAPDAAKLVKALRDIFMPLAPTLRIYATGGSVLPRPVALADTPGATIVGWQHHGVFLGLPLPGNSALYTSERIGMTNPKPADAFPADLGGGASILMPTTLYRDDKGTLPHVPPAQIHLHKPALFVPSGLDRSTRLADVILSWNVFQHFYPYFAEEPVDWAAVLDVTLAEAATDGDEAEFRATLSKELAALRDGHGYVYFPHQKELSLPVLWDWVEDRLVVLRVEPDVKGLRPGDVVDRIDGVPVANLLAHLMPTIAASTPQFQMDKALWAIMRRTSSAPVTVQAHHPDGTAVTAALTPDEYKIDPLAFDDLKPVSELRPGIWYVDLRRFKKSDLDGTLSGLAGAKAIVIDMRGYPTPDALMVVAHLSDKPIPTGQFDIPVASVPDQTRVTYQSVGWSLPAAVPRFTGKFVFLTDADAASYGDMVMGMVEDNHLGAIVGGPTAGIDGTINPFVLPGDYRLNWTGFRVRKLDGSRFMGVGVSPTVPAAPTIAGIAAGRDEVLEKGLAVADGRR